MKKLLLLTLLSIFIVSCEPDDSPEPIPGPEEVYFQIEEDEYKVDNFRLEFNGDYEVSYQLYNSELNTETLNPEKGDLIEEGEITVQGDYTFEKETGFVIFEFQIANIQEEGSFSIFINNELFFRDFTVDQYNMGEAFFIPYKYDDSMILD